MASSLHLLMMKHALKTKNDLLFGDLDLQGKQNEAFPVPLEEQRLQNTEQVPASCQPVGAGTNTDHTAAIGHRHESSDHEAMFRPVCPTELKPHESFPPMPAASHPARPLSSRRAIQAFNEGNTVYTPGMRHLKTQSVWRKSTMDTQRGLESGAEAVDSRQSSINTTENTDLLNKSQPMNVSHLDPCSLAQIQPDTVQLDSKVSSMNLDELLAHYRSGFHTHPTAAEDWSSADTLNLYATGCQAYSLNADIPAQSKPLCILFGESEKDKTKDELSQKLKAPQQGEMISSWFESLEEPYKGWLLQNGELTEFEQNSLAETLLQSEMYTHFNNLIKSTKNPAMRKSLLAKLLEVERTRLKRAGILSDCTEAQEEQKTDSPDKEIQVAESDYTEKSVEETQSEDRSYESDKSRSSCDMYESFERSIVSSKMYSKEEKFLDIRKRFALAADAGHIFGLHLESVRQQAQDKVRAYERKRERMQKAFMQSNCSDIRKENEKTIERRDSVESKKPGLEVNEDSTISLKNEGSILTAPSYPFMRDQVHDHRGICVTSDSLPFQGPLRRAPNRTRMGGRDSVTSRDAGAPSFGRSSVYDPIRTTPIPKAEFDKIALQAAAPRPAKERFDPKTKEIEASQCEQESYGEKETQCKPTSDVDEDLDEKEIDAANESDPLKRDVGILVSNRKVRHCLSRSARKRRIHRDGKSNSNQKATLKVRPEVEETMHVDEGNPRVVVSETINKSLHCTQYPLFSPPPKKLLRPLKQSMPEIATASPSRPNPSPSFEPTSDTSARGISKPYGVNASYEAILTDLGVDTEAISESRGGSALWGTGERLGRLIHSTPNPVQKRPPPTGNGYFASTEGVADLIDVQSSENVSGKALISQTQNFAEKQPGYFTSPTIESQNSSTNSKLSVGIIGGDSQILKASEYYEQAQRERIHHMQQKASAICEVTPKPKDPLPTPRVTFIDGKQGSLLSTLHSSTSSNSKFLQSNLSNLDTTPGDERKSPSPDLSSSQVFMNSLKASFSNHYQHSSSDEAESDAQQDTFKRSFGDSTTDYLHLTKRQHPWLGDEPKQTAKNEIDISQLFGTLTFQGNDTSFEQGIDSSHQSRSRRVPNSPSLFSHSRQAPKVPNQHMGLNHHNATDDRLAYYDSPKKYPSQNLNNVSVSSMLLLEDDFNSISEDGSVTHFDNVDVNEGADQTLTKGEKLDLPSF